MYSTFYVFLCITVNGIQAPDLDGHRNLLRRELEPNGDEFPASRPEREQDDDVSEDDSESLEESETAGTNNWVGVNGTNVTITATRTAYCPNQKNITRWLSDARTEEQKMSGKIFTCGSKLGDECKNKSTDGCTRSTQDTVSETECEVACAEKQDCKSLSFYVMFIVYLDSLKMSALFGLTSLRMFLYHGTQHQQRQMRLR